MFFLPYDHILQFSDPIEVARPASLLMDRMKPELFTIVQILASTAWLVACGQVLHLLCFTISNPVVVNELL